MSTKSGLVLVTGGTGYISSWIVKQLLDEGYKVRATVRDPNSAKCEFLKVLEGAKDRLELVACDLNSEKGWPDAVKGCTYVLHVASPYSLKVDDPQKDLVDPAVNGTLFVFRACRAEPSVKRVVLTSSVAAVSDCFDEWESHVYGPADWNATSTLDRNPYYLSKTLAEKAAHDFMEKESPAFSLAVMNPFAVMGPALDTKSPVNQSVETVVAIMAGKFPIALPIAIGVVDVRDVALAHVRAMQIDEAGGGKRFILWSKALQNYEIGRIIKEMVPASIGWKVPTREPFGFLPKGLTTTMVRLVEGKDTASFLDTNWGKNPTFDVSLAKDVLKMEFRPAEDTVKDTVKWVLEHDKVPKMFGLF